MLPQLNIRRTYLIARRDFLGYIKTWGFWISFLMPFIFGTLGILASSLEINVDPVRYETILDETGQYGNKIRAYDQKRRSQKPIEDMRKMLVGLGTPEENIKKIEELYLAQENEKLAQLAPNLDLEALQGGNSKIIYVDPPSQDIGTLKSYLTGSKTLDVDGNDVSLASLLHIYEKDGELQVDFWADNISNERLKSVADRYFENEARKSYLESGGLSSDGLKDALDKAPNVKAYDPGKAADEGSQAVTFHDRIPTFVALAATLLLWLTIFSGAYMLLTSMLEEKLNKLLEMMLSTTRLSEVMIGKLIGVAALTITAMLPYLALMLGGAILIAVQSPDMAAPLMSAFTPKLITFFFVFLILGYLFYGALFIALGSLAESMQDAQTLTTPIMLVLTACIMVVPLSLNSPDSPMLTFASWFPLSAPFAGIARLPQDPPWWELTLSAVFLFLSAMFVIWLAGRIFRYGVLSGSGVKGVTAWFKRVILRRKA